MNRLAMAAICSLVAGHALAGCRDQQKTDFPVAVANGETLVGVYSGPDAGVASFRGIPYASPPVGGFRWQAPHFHRPRDGTQSAAEFASACYQDSYSTDWYRKVGQAFGATPDRFSDPPFSEDCLYLNIWTPEVRAGAGLPVMVWIHGGANRSGWSFEPNYRGERLAEKGSVVVVSVAYRLGIFGFFSHPQLRGQPAAANFGLLDQIAALRWVQENIRAFGGDPGNVTIFGESAGAANIGYLMASPSAQGLFHRAISQSGGYQMLETPQIEEAERMGAALADALPGRPDLAGLRHRESGEIWSAALAALPDHDYEPVVDGHSLQAPVAVTYKNHGLPADLLIGSNEDEWYMYVDGERSSFEAELLELPAAARGALQALAAQESDLRRGHDRAVTFANMVCPAYRMADAAARSGKQAWVYRFTRARPGPGGERLRAYHGAEIPYVFDSHDDWLPGDAADARLTDVMMRYWINFARNGDPNGDKLPAWPAFGRDDARVQELGSRIGPMPGPDAALCKSLSASLYAGLAQ